MYLLSDETLLEAHQKALELNLDEEFILILEEEINKRGLKINHVKLSKRKILQEV